MKRNKKTQSNSNKSKKAVTNTHRKSSTDGKEVGFEPESRSFELDEDSEHSFELRD